MAFTIVNLADRTEAVDGTAVMFHQTFLAKSPDWPTIDAARDEVIESLEPGKISRIAVDPLGNVIGWIGALPQYHGRVWEIHPLAVAGAHQGRGLGRALVHDLEAIVRERGAVTLIAGADDEQDETSVSGVDLYPDIPGAIRDIRNLRRHQYEFYLRVGFTIVGLVPDANGIGKPDIILAKRVARAAPAV